MDSARISALLEPFLDAPLSPAQLHKISTYIDLLLRWNARINLTAIRDPEQIVPRHFGESLFLARYLFPTHKQQEAAQPFAPSAKGGNTATESTQEMPPRVIDLGSGAGFPALPIKIWAPELCVTLIEANHKKAAFLREVIRSLTLTNVDVIPERAETVLARLTGPCHSERSEGSARSSLYEGAHVPADVVTLRAVEKFDRILPLAANFLTPHGRLALLISSAQEPKLSAMPRLKWTRICIPQSYTRILAIGER